MKTFFTKYTKKGFWWFRILGYGIFVRDIKRFPLSAEEKRNRWSTVKISKFYIKWLYNGMYK